MSRVENLVTGNKQLQVQALNDSELALREIEAIAMGYITDGDLPLIEGVTHQFRRKVVGRMNSALL